MTLSPKAQEVYSQINGDNLKLGDLRKIAKEIKKDHDLAMELWSTGEFHPRLLSLLIMDKNHLTQEVINQLAIEMSSHELDQRNHLADWLLTNQLSKSKKTKELIENWEHHPSPMLRRIFWYYQARLRWLGQTPPDNTADLLASLEGKMATAEPEVQWAMNFTAGQIGIYEAPYREQCIALGERIGLYKGDPVPRNCTPDYLPEFIAIEAAKLGK